MSLRKNAEFKHEIKNAVYLLSRELIRNWAESHSSPPIDAANAIETLYQCVEKIEKQD